VVEASAAAIIFLHYVHLAPLIWSWSFGGALVGCLELVWRHCAADWGSPRDAGIGVGQNWSADWREGWAGVDHGEY